MARMDANNLGLDSLISTAEISPAEQPSKILCISVHSCHSRLHLGAVEHPGLSLLFQSNKKHGAIRRGIRIFKIETVKLDFRGASLERSGIAT
jgi:hypothetical protein